MIGIMLKVVLEALAARVGRARGDAMTENRTHVVMARFNSEELEKLENLRKVLGMTKGGYIRMVALRENPTNTVVPELNRAAWIELSRSASNLNQIAKHLNESGFDTGVVDSIIQVLDDFRTALIGASMSLAESAE
jgi:hypothetical protein